MTGQNNMSEIPAVLNESHQETFSSLKDSFNFLEFHLSGILSYFLANTS